MENGPPPPTEEEKKNSAKIFKLANIFLIICLIFISATGGLCLSGTVNLAGRTWILPDFQSRLEFTLKYQTLPLLWLLLLILNVVFQRAKTSALNPLMGRDIFFKKQSNILQNTLEQFILSAFAQFILVSFLDEVWTLRVIPWVNFLLLLGRVTYYAGYPVYRGFGMFLGFLPTAGMVFVAVYKFFEHLFF